VEETDEEAVIHNSENDNDIYEQVKAHSIQLSRLTDIVESLQSQMKILQEIRSGGGPQNYYFSKKEEYKTKKTKGRKRTKGNKRNEIDIIGRHNLQEQS